MPVDSNINFDKGRRIVFQNTTTELIYRQSALVDYLTRPRDIAVIRKENAGIDFLKQ